MTGYQWFIAATMTFQSGAVVASVMNRNWQIVMYWLAVLALNYSLAFMGKA